MGRSIACRLLLGDTRATQTMKTFFPLLAAALFCLVKEGPGAWEKFAEEQRQARGAGGEAT